MPIQVEYTAAKFNSAARYFPLVGALIGGCAAIVFLAAAHVWPNSVAIALSMAATVLLTGALHEDGFADSCDGFGGGWQREQILTIMQDSRIGSYAAIGLVLLLSIKFLSLSALVEPMRIVCALVVAHAWSRLLAVSYLLDLDYVRADTSAKVRPTATELGRNELLVAGLTVTPLFLLIGSWRTGAAVVVLFAWRWLFARYLRRRISGYTGDCLGCAQQVAELLIYLVLAAA